MDEMEQRHVVIVGAGIMGASLAQVYAQGGWKVFLYNRSQQGLDRARGTILKNQELLCAQGMLSPEEAAARREEIFSAVWQVNSREHNPSPRFRTL